MKKLAVLFAMMIGMLSASLVAIAEDSRIVGNVNINLPAGWNVQTLDQAGVEAAGQEDRLLSSFAQNKGSIRNVTLVECAWEGERVMVAIVEPRDELAMLLTLNATIGDVQEAKLAGTNHDFYWVDDLSAYLVAVDNLSHLYFIAPAAGERLPTEFLRGFSIEALL